ncbi:MAG: TonB-dependent receptor, partial [Bacteroidales bacterium]|nr:TonB-dependent receptor [Bacteroidales bacterium]
MFKQKFQIKKAFRFKRFERKNYSAYNSMHKVVTIGVVSVMTLTHSPVTKAVGQQTNTDSLMMYGSLPQVTVSDDAATPVSLAGVVVNVVDKRQIEALKPQSINELLDIVSGVDLQTRGKHGVQADISLRGGNFDQTAVLLNGINITNPHTGHYSMDIPVNISDIERIEILSGPSSLAYGAGAFSGAVNIITKKGSLAAVDTKKPAVDAEVTAGEHGLWAVETSVAKNFNRHRHSLSLATKNSDGYTKNSAYNIYNALWQSRITMKQEAFLDFQAGFQHKDYDANTFYSAKYPDQHEKTSSFLTSARFAGRIADNFSVNTSAYFTLHTDEFELIKNVSTPNYHKSHVTGNNTVFSYTQKAFNLKFGSDVRWEEILSSVLGEECQTHSTHYNHHKDRVNVSFFALGEYVIKNLTLSLGASTFQNTSFSQSPFSFYPSAALRWEVNRNWQIYAQSKAATRLPSFTELYYSDAVHTPNPSLKQEKSTSWELGAKHLCRFAVTSLNAYYMKGKDMIDWMKFSPQDAKWQSRNINNLNKYGFELNTRVYLNEISSVFSRRTLFDAGYCFMDQQQADNDYISSYALNYLKHKFTFATSFEVYKNLFVSVSGRYCVR